MADKLPESVLRDRLDEAAKLVEVGAKYNYKGSEYEVIELAIQEVDDVVCVIYKANYGSKLIFTRPVSSWVEEVHVNGASVKRFSKL